MNYGTSSCFRFRATVANRIHPNYAHTTECKKRCTVLKAEQLPARVPNLRARLAHVDEDRLTHCAWLSATLR